MIPLVLFNWSGIRYAINASVVERVLKSPPIHPGIGTTEAPFLGWVPFGGQLEPCFYLDSLGKGYWELQSPLLVLHHQRQRALCLVQNPIDLVQGEVALAEQQDHSLLVGKAYTPAEVPYLGIDPIWNYFFSRGIT